MAKNQNGDREKGNTWVECTVDSLLNWWVQMIGEWKNLILHFYTKKKKQVPLK